MVPRGREADDAKRGTHPERRLRGAYGLEHGALGSAAHAPRVEVPADEHDEKPHQGEKSARRLPESEALTFQLGSIAVEDVGRDHRGAARDKEPSRSSAERLR